MASKGTADFADFRQIKGRLPPVGLPVCLYRKVHKEGTMNTKGIDWLADWKVWGAAPRPGREKFSLHSRHVCDVP